MAARKPDDLRYVKGANPRTDVPFPDFEDPDNGMSTPDGALQLSRLDSDRIEAKNQRDLRDTAEREIANTPGGIDYAPGGGMTVTELADEPPPLDGPTDRVRGGTDWSKPEMMAGDATGAGFGKARRMALDAILAAQIPKQEMVDDTDAKAPAPTPYSDAFRPFAEMQVADAPGGIDLAPRKDYIPASKRTQIDVPAAPMNFSPMDVTAGPPKVSVSRPPDSSVGRDFVASISPPAGPPAEAGGVRGATLKAIQGMGMRPEVANYLAAKQGGGDGSDDELDRAQRLAQLMGSVSLLGRATNTLGAGLAHRPVDQSFYDELDKQSQRPVTDIMQRRQEQDRRAKAGLDTARAQAENAKLASEAALSDPNSPETQRARDTAKAVFAKLGQNNPAALKAFDTMTGAEIAKTVPIVQKVMDDEANRTEKGREFDLRNKELDERRREASMQHQDNMAFKLSQAEEKSAEKRDQQTNKDTQNLEKRLGPDASDFATNYADAAAIVNKYGKGNLPGIGTVRGHLPAWAVSDDGIKLRQALGKMSASFRHEMTGAAASNAERAELAKISGLADNGTDQEVIDGLKTLKELHDNHLRRTYGGFSPQVSQAYQQRNPQLTPGALDVVGVKGDSQAPRMQYSASRNQTRIIYPDGRVEVRDGKP